MFPQSFYQTEHAVTLKRTTNPTGILGNPLDLISHPRPWLTIETTAAKEILLKKTLIFADHFYSSRSPFIKIEIKEKLKLAKEAGFNIFILSPSNGLLESWGGRDIPLDYMLPLKSFTKESIFTLAWSQQHLNANSLFLLDYFGINELIAYERNQIDFTIFKDKPEDFSILTATAPCNTYTALFTDAEAVIKLTEHPFNQCVPQLEAIKFSKHIENVGEFIAYLPLLPQLKKISFQESALYISPFLMRAPLLEDIEIIGCENTANFFQKIGPGALPHLKKINLSGSMITPQNVNALLIAAPKLENIILSGCNGIEGVFLGTAPNALPHLKKIDLWNSAITKEDVNGLLGAALRLEEIDFSHCEKITGVFQGIAPNALPHLKKINLSESAINSDDFSALLKAAPHVEEIDLNECKGIAGEFKEIAHSSSLHLKKINLKVSAITSNNVNLLLKIAPQLEEIDLHGCGDIENAFRGIGPGELPHLKQVDVSESSILETSFNTLVRAAPYVEEVNLSNCFIDIESLFQGIGPGELPRLKIIDLSDVEIDSTELNNLLIAAPCMEKISLSNCVRIEMAFNGIAPGELPHLKVVDLSGSTIYGNSVNALCKAATHLEKIALHECCCIADVFQELAPGSLAHLKTISLYKSDASPQDIDALCKAAPHLKKTDIDLKFPDYNPMVPSDRTTRCTTELNEDFFDTAPSEHTMLSFKRYFRAIEPGLYRLNLWQPQLDTLNPPPGIVEANDFRPIELKEKRDYPDDQFMCYQGIKSVITSADDTAIILPSLDAEEQLFDVTVIDHATEQPITAYTIQHSASTRFYQVTLDERGEFSIQYQVAIPAVKPELPAAFYKLARRYNAYTPQKLPKDENINTLRDYANYFRANKTGSCEQRSIAAYAELLGWLNVRQKNLRIARNDLHAYLEVRIRGVWSKLDLGGYAAQLNEIPIHGAQDELLLAEAEYAPAPAPAPEPQYLITESTMEEVMANTKPALILVDSDVAVKTLFAGFPYPLDLFIAHRPEELSLSGASMTQEGIITPARTRFSQWSENRAQGIICVDIREFNASELAQLNDLLDGRIEHQTLPPNIRTLLLDNPNRGYYGPDFRRRMPQKTKVQAVDNAPLLEARPADFEQQSIEIDLFNSFYWQRFLVGAWGMEQKPGDRDLSFRWQQGPLLRALQGGIQHIVLKNPPLADPSFTTFMAELQSLKRIEWADQTTVVANEVRFYQTTGYHWAALSRGVSLAQWTGRELGSDLPYTLSDANILSFIQNICYEFAISSNQLEPAPCYLEHCRAAGVINVVCVYGLSESTLAQFLATTQAQGIRVNFLMPTQTVPEHSPLLKLVPFLDPVVPHPAEAVAFSTQVQWQIHHDVEFATRHILAQSPQVSHFDMSCLEPAELGRFPVLSKETRQALFTTGKLSMIAPLSELVQKLQVGERVLLSGKIPPALYEALTSLSLGHIERSAFPGQLLILVPTEDKTIAQAIAGHVLAPPEAANLAQKITLLQHVHPTTTPILDEFLQSSGLTLADFTTLERRLLQFQLGKILPMISEDELTPLSDSVRAEQIDENRWHSVEAALNLNPWVMLEGSTGIGKSHFLQYVLPKHRPTVFQLEQWLASPSILVLDEASFLSELSGEGAHFLERFNGLRTNPPSFLWKGKYHTLTPEHKVVFAFNPASYGAGRSTAGFLSEQALHVSFNTLPDFYVKERMIVPLLDKLMTQRDLDLNLIADPLVSVYRWLIDHSPANEVLITPREIKAMVHLIVSPINRYNITEPETILLLATEIAHTIGKQTLDEHTELVPQFETEFPPPQSTLIRHVLPEQYLPYQNEVYGLIQDMLQARTLLSSDNPDLGLGGIVLEGGSGIGKTYFIEQIAKESRIAGRTIYRISPSTPFHDKEAILKQASSDKEALVIAEEINTSLWPNKLLNNFLMGLDAEGNPATTPMLIATQNPPSFAGRSEEDPARRKRMVKIILNWPVYMLPVLQSVAAAEVPTTHSDYNELHAAMIRDIPEYAAAQDENRYGLDFLEAPMLEDSFTLMDPDPGLPEHTVRRKGTHNACFFSSQSADRNRSESPSSKRTKREPQTDHTSLTLNL